MYRYQRLPQSDDAGPSPADSPADSALLLPSVADHDPAINSSAR